MSRRGQDNLSGRILYEDNHLLALNKLPGELVQGDATGDLPLVEELRQFIKVRDAKPGNVFLQVIHRIDRPVSGAVLFAKTSKAVERMNALFRDRRVERTYWAIVEKQPPAMEGIVEGYMYRNARQNKSYMSKSERSGSKFASLRYCLVGASTNYYLLEVSLDTGRHHQIRCQLASIGCTIRGDLKYGARRSLPDGGINLHARSVSFLHPVAKEPVSVVAPPPADSLWDFFPR